jgi:hypothetical protein
MIHKYQSRMGQQKRDTSNYKFFRVPKKLLWFKLRDFIVNTFPEDSHLSDIVLKQQKLREKENNCNNLSTKITSSNKPNSHICEFNFGNFLNKYWKDRIVETLPTWNVKIQDSNANFLLLDNIIFVFKCYIKVEHSQPNHEKSIGHPTSISESECWKLK